MQSQSKVSQCFNRRIVFTSIDIDNNEKRKGEKKTKIIIIWVYLQVYHYINSFSKYQITLRSFVWYAVFVLFSFFLCSRVLCSMRAIIWYMKRYISLFYLCGSRSLDRRIWHPLYPAEAVDCSNKRFEV